MAILYGTTGDGTTLPVLVDQFGNLLAKGIDGPPGPPGPPGVGQLPPDPYEGAILGWEDGELAWLGGSVQLPAGTYGPYTYIDGDERLDIPQDASSLVNGQQLYMSDFYGNKTTAEFSTDTIASVAQQSLTVNGFYSCVFASKSVTGTVTCGGVGYTGAGYGQQVYVLDQNNLWHPVTNDVGDNNFNEDITSTLAGLSITSIQGLAVSGNRCEPVNCTGPDTATLHLGSFVINGVDIFGSNTSIIATQGIDTRVYPDKYTWTAFMLGTDGAIGEGSTTSVQGFPTLTFPTDNNFDKFEVGDVVQPGVSITAINDTVPSITVDGGSWSGADGTGGDTEIRKVMSGSGSVFLGTNGAILLRDNNGEWVDDFYVTAPEQRIAARKLASAAIRRKKK